MIKYLWPVPEIILKYIVRHKHYNLFYLHCLSHQGNSDHYITASLIAEYNTIKKYIYDSQHESGQQGCVSDQHKHN